ncbi:unnamed protein product [Knipowitschia caucasica]
MRCKKSQEEPSSPSQRRRSCFGLRGRRKKGGAIRGKLRMRSLPGAFILLGLLVVVVGTALAVAGYWPYKLSKATLMGLSGQGDEALAGWSLGAKGLVSTARANLVHSDRMKLLGPVIMGVGLFILICANTVLYENRDRETQMLLAQMRSVICSVSAAVPSADLQDMAVTNSMTKHYQWVSSLPAAHLNILCVSQLACSEPVLLTQSSGERDYHQAAMQTQALHHQESQSTPSLKLSNSSSSSNSCTSIQTELAKPSSDSSLPKPIRSIPLVKVNSCLVSASSMSTLGVDESVEVPRALPRRCHSLSYRTNPHKHPVHFRKEVVDGEGRQMAHGSQSVCVSIPGQITEKMSEDFTHQSWPRLDLGIGRRYLKLENKEDSVEKLLDQLESQCSQWDKSFGSGPFQ